MSDTPTIPPAPFEALYRWVLSDPRQLPPEVCEEVERLRALGGFTREDLDALDRASYRYGFCRNTESCDGCDDCDGPYLRFLSLPARIAALLPKVP